MPTVAEIIRHHDPEPTADIWVQGKPAAAESIHIVDYDPTWPVRFLRVAADILRALAEHETRALSIEHVGSTSVPGLPAKDVIDVDLTVADPTDEDAYIPALAAIGYTHVIREWFWHEHRALRLDEPRVNLHVFGPDCPETLRHRMFRDWLRTHEDDRARYAEAKRAAAQGGAQRVMEYNERKQDVIRDIYDRLFRAAGLH